MALCNDYAVVQAITAPRPKDWDNMRLLPVPLFVLFFSVHFKFTLLSAHVQEAKNSIENLSQQIVIVAKLSPQFHQEPVVLPTPLRELVVDKRSD